MAECGWIKLHRKIRDSEIWNDKPYDRARAWIDLILSANHEVRDVVLGNDVIQVQRGSFITSIRKLCDKWGWSNTKVVSFLNLLKKQQMISYISDTKKTVVTLGNYGIYQDGDVTETSPKRHENDAKTTRKHTNNNVKNLKNVKKVIYGEKVLLLPEEYQKLVDANGEADAKEMIAILDNWYLTKGKPPNNSDYHTMIGKGWVLERLKQDKQRAGPVEPKRNRHM